MKINSDTPIHLTYCLNIHKGETWEENLRAIQIHAAEVKRQVSPQKSFGLGLRLSAQAAATLLKGDELARLQDVLASRDMYVFTVNGFPYGPFHGMPIKENVYKPDWRTPERVAYTNNIASALSRLLRPGETGSISTVPGSYKAWITSSREVQAILHGLMDSVAHLARIKENKGIEISLGLEPEPDCFLETTGDAVAFFQKQVFAQGPDYLKKRHSLSGEAAESAVRRHLSLCFDTCHMALQFESIESSLKMLAEAGVPVSKIQISAALKSEVNDGLRARLGPFLDEVYLHQVKIRDKRGKIISIPDLPQLMQMDLTDMAGAEFRAHFHLPLYYNGYRGLCSTNDGLTTAFFRRAAEIGVAHWEIETYTFDVLPEALRAMGPVDSIIKEFEWIGQKIPAKRDASHLR